MWIDGNALYFLSIYSKDYLLVDRLCLSLVDIAKHIFTPRFSGFGVKCGVNSGIDHQLTVVRPELNFCCISFEVCSEELSAYRSSDICAVVCPIA